MKTLKKALSVILCAVILITAAPLSGFVGMKFPEINFGKFMRTLNSFSDPITPTANAAIEISLGSDIEIVYDTFWQAPTALCFKGNGEFKISANDEGWNEWNNILSEVEYIYFTEGITAISADSFSFATKLKTIGTLKKISNGSNTDYKFFDNLPSSITSIGDRAFEGCSSLDNIVFPDKLVSIGDGAFMNCALTSVSIPGTLTNIGEYAFYGCPIETITVDLSNNFFTVKNNVLYNKSETELILYPSKSTYTTFTIPTGVKTIEKYAFSDCGTLTEIHIPDSVTSIGDKAFYFCRALTEIHIPDSVTSIGNYTFFSCASLTEIHIPDSVTSIGSGTFCNCNSLTEIHIPDSVTSIGEDAFQYCTNLSEVNFAPGSVLETIGSLAFYDCDSLTRIQIPATVTLIDDKAFEHCDNLTEIEFLSPAPPTVSDRIFKNTHITSIKIPQLSENRSGISMQKQVGKAFLLLISPTQTHALLFLLMKAIKTNTDLHTIHLIPKITLLLVSNTTATALMLLFQG